MRLSDWDQRQLDQAYSEHMDCHARDQARVASAMMLEVCTMVCPTLAAQIGFQEMFDAQRGIDPILKIRTLASALHVALSKWEWPEPSRRPENT